MRKRRKSISRLGFILFALLIAILLTGVAYGIWSDKSFIRGTIETGTWDIALSSSGNYPYAELNFVSSNSTTDSVYVSSNSTQSPTYVRSDINGRMIEIIIVNAQPNTDYSCAFDMRNIGTVPVRIQNIGISGLPAELAAQISGVGVIIDPGQNWGGSVRVQLIDAARTGTDFTFSVVVQPGPWNQP